MGADAVSSAREGTLEAGRLELEESQVHVASSLLPVAGAVHWSMAKMVST